ncbi:flagellar hook-length control protein FliK [Nitrosophilus alvini]|uniref:flagellar hook-length control protein FliK n=1 Tax=Nitrosophilus alvini TaxID=2714855 RepID=UPI00190CB387|nr:flagellar hook-length control protein FliK [Nitrosophilus alvini]
MIHFKPFNENIEFLILTKPLGKSISFKAGETLKAEVIDILPNGGVIARIKGQHVAIKTEIPLRKDDSLLLRVMDSANSDKSLKLQFLTYIKPQKSQFSELEKNLKTATQNLQRGIVSQNSDIKILLKSADAAENLKMAVSKLLHQTNLLSQTKNILNDTISLLEDIGKIPMKNETLQNISKAVSEIFVNAENIAESNIKNMLQNSGVLYEAKLKEVLKNRENRLKHIKSDLKGLLLGLKEEIIKIGGGSDTDKKIDQVLSQIEILQLYSKATDAFYTFLPIIWEGLEEGSIAFKKRKGKKEFYLCRISLNFSAFGEIEVMALLNRSEINITFRTQSNQLRDVLSADIQNLKNEIEKDGIRVGFIKFINSSDKNFDEFMHFENVVNIKV